MHASISPPQYRNQKVWIYKLCFFVPSLKTKRCKLCDLLPLDSLVHVVININRHDKINLQFKGTMLLVIQSSIPGQQANNGLKSLQQSSPLLLVYLLCSLSRLWSLCHKVKNLRALSTQDGLMVCKLTHGNNDQQCLVSMPYGISVSMFITCHYLCSNVHFVLILCLFLSVWFLSIVPMMSTYSVNRPLITM